MNKMVIENQNSELVRFILDSPIAICLIQNKIIKLVNTSFSEMFEYSEETLIGYPFDKLISEDNRKEALARYQNLSGDTELSLRQEIEGIKKNGEKFPLEIFLSERIIGNSKQYVYFCMDITERKKTELLLRENEQRYRTLVENAPDTILLYDHDIESFIDCNKQASILLGIPREKILGMPPTRLYELNPKESMNDAIKTRIDHVLKFDEKITAQVEIVHITGRKIPCELRMVRVPSDTKNLVRGSLINISERMVAQKELQRIREQLYRSQRMESIGRLSGSLAHDLNNIHMVISGYSQLLELIIEDEDAQEYLTKINEASNRASDLIRQLLSFSRKRILNPTTINLKETINEVHSLIRTMLPQNISLQVNMDEDLSNINIDKGSFEQVLMNLAVNSKDAMPFGGKVKIIAENILFSVNINDVPEDYVKIAFSDNGVGMDQETIDRSMEPFFTTKPEGRGTGLGLSTAYGIISQSGGIIEVTSEIDKGSTFMIYIPKSSDQLLKTKPIKTIVPKIDGSGKKILVIDDEKMVAQLLEEVLSSNFFTTTHFSDVLESLEYYENNFKNIDLVITDIVMPELNGLELSKKFKEINKDVNILFMTGYTRGEIVDEIKSMGYKILDKPFTSEDLVTVLSEYF